MPEEIAFISVVAIISGCVLVVSLSKMILGFLRDRAGISKQTTGSSMTTSELESMLKRVVAEANEPLLDRIEALENTSEKALPPHKRDSILDDIHDGPNDLAAISKRQQGRQGVV